MSLLADYLQERGVKHIIEDARGFATYYFVNEGCYIEDVYVAPPYRKQGLTKDMVNQIAIVAKEKGYSRLLSSCVPSSNGSTEALKAAFGCGFSLHTSTDNLIICKREI